jgi:dolichol kinase
MVVVPLAGWLVVPWAALALAAAAALASLVVEVSRRWFPWINRLLWRLLPSVFRPGEEFRVLGSSWFALGAVVAFLLYDYNIGGVAVLYLTLGDPAAELVGRRWGQPGRRKTWAGTLGCLAACLAAAALGVVLGGLNHWAVLTGALVATLVERWSPPPDDNVWIPILSGAAVLAVQYMIGG